MINVRQMEVFRAVLLSGTVSGAARYLRVSQPAVSMALNRLQNTLGVLLFDRVRGRLLPTPEALRLFEEIEAAWKGIERVTAFADELSQDRSEILRVAVQASLGSGVLPSIVTRLLDLHPRLKVKVELVTPQLLIEALLVGDSDIGLAFEPIDHPHLLIDRIGSARLVCAMLEDHPLAKLDAVLLVDLTGYRQISHSMQMTEGRLIEDAFAAADLKQDAGIEVRSGQTACHFVQAGAGIALIDDAALAVDTFKGLVVRPLRDSPTGADLYRPQR